MEIIASNNDNLLMTIRSAIEDISETEGINYLQEYFSPSKPFYTGSHFESLEADNNPEDRITGSDLYAVATLNTPIKRQAAMGILRSEEHTSELQSRFDLVCRLLLEKKK